jgi:hypothetical protein
MRKISVLLVVVLLVALLPFISSSPLSKKAAAKAASLRAKASASAAAAYNEAIAAAAAGYKPLLQETAQAAYPQAAYPQPVWPYGFAPPSSFAPPPGALWAPSPYADDAAAQAALQLTAPRLDPEGVDPSINADPYQMARSNGLGGAGSLSSGVSQMARTGPNGQLNDPYQAQYSGEPVPAIPDNFQGMSNPAMTPSMALCDPRISDNCGFQGGPQVNRVPRLTMAGDDLRSTTGPTTPTHPYDRMRWGQLNRLLPSNQNPAAAIAPGGMYDPMPRPTEAVPLPNYIQNSRAWTPDTSVFPEQGAPGTSDFSSKTGSLATKPPQVPLTPTAPQDLPAETPSQGGPGDNALHNKPNEIEPVAN